MWAAGAEEQEAGVRALQGHIATVQALLRKSDGIMQSACSLFPSLHEPTFWDLDQQVAAAEAPCFQKPILAKSCGAAWDTGFSSCEGRAGVQDVEMGALPEESGNQVLDSAAEMAEVAAADKGVDRLCLRQGCS